MKPADEVAAGLVRVEHVEGDPHPWKAIVCGTAWASFVSREPTETIAGRYRKTLADVIRADRRERLLYLTGPPPVEEEREEVLRLVADDTITDGHPVVVQALRDLLALLDHTRAYARHLELELGQQAAFDAGRASRDEEVARLREALEAVRAAMPGGESASWWAEALGKAHAVADHALKDAHGAGE